MLVYSESRGRANLLFQWSLLNILNIPPSARREGRLTNPRLNEGRWSVYVHHVSPCNDSYRIFLDLVVVDIRNDGIRYQLPISPFADPDGVRSWENISRLQRVPIWRVMNRQIRHTLWNTRESMWHNGMIALKFTMYQSVGGSGLISHIGTLWSGDIFFLRSLTKCWHFVNALWTTHFK